MERNAHELSDMELLDALCLAVSEAGIFNRGTIFEVGQRYHLSKAQYLRSVALARFEGEKPPARIGDVLMLHETEPPSVVSLNHTHMSQYLAIVLQNTEYTVTHMYYLGSGEWAYLFEGQGEYLFPAKSFTHPTVASWRSCR